LAEKDLATVQNYDFKGQCEDKVPGFCATRSKNGTQGIRSKNIDEFIPAVEQANIAWIDM
jgi:hypothetical protein